MIANMEATVKCRQCEYYGPMDDGGDEHHFATPIVMCPKCNGPVDIQSGKQCTVRNVRLRVDDDGEEEEIDQV